MILSPVLADQHSSQNIAQLFLFSQESEVIMHSNDAFAPVAYLQLKKLNLVDKVSRDS